MRIAGALMVVTGCASSQPSSSPPPAPSTATSASTTTSGSTATSASTDLDADVAPFDASFAVADAGPTPISCPSDMAAVEGDYCTDVRQDCLVWMEPPAAEMGRCRTFAPSTCHGTRLHKRFCIDVDEYTRADEKLPMTHVSWTEAKKVCEDAKKRLCLESEWNFACEGEHMLPYPTGLERPAKQCNFDQMKLLDARGATRDLRKPSASMTECTSPFGVRNLSGNVDEWTFRDVMNGANRTALKGGWWMAARNRCRPATTAHGEIYRDFQTGFRCCADGADAGAGDR